MPAKPSGGKALMRLLLQLDALGLHDLAEVMLESKVPDEAREAVRAARTQFSHAPRSQNETAVRGGRAPEREHAPFATVAEEYARVATQRVAPTGPPTPSGPQWRSLGP